MNLKLTFIFSCITLSCVNGALLLWGNHKFQIPPLKPFNEESLQDLIEQLGYPEVAIYKTSSPLAPGFKQLLDGYYTSYNPNSDINPENATEISAQEDLALLEMKQYIESSRNTNTLSILLIPNDERQKREVVFSQTNSTVKGPVIYKTKSKKDTYGLLYSSQPLLLKTDSSNVLLGNTPPDMINMDTTNKDSYTRLNVKIHVEEENNVVILRFVFAWTSNGYWSLNAVKVSDTNGNYSFNLTTSTVSNVAAHFSYHCNGATIFSDPNRTAELHIFDLQVQIDANAERFDDAYDCVDFTTAPILSGLFVTAILGVALILALVMISDIKTMDKFDNHKTKQLNFTVAE